ncbi:MAG TPA: YlxR family protein [Firmicutes bacterium]|nr:YlxR family protein [Bacillota bacterium]
MADPVRKCAGCGRKTIKTELLRVVRLQSKNVLFDPKQKLQGRSMYFCPELTCFHKLVRKKAPHKILKAPISVQVINDIESYLSRAESIKMI